MKSILMMCTLSFALMGMMQPESITQITNENISHFQLTSDGGYLALGSKIHIPEQAVNAGDDNYKTESYFLGKVDASGNLEWHNRYSINSENPPTVTETDSGYTIHSYTDNDDYYFKNELQLSFDGDSIEFRVDSMPYTSDSSWVDTTTLPTHEFDSTWDIESVVDGYRTETLSPRDTVHLQNGTILILWVYHRPSFVSSSGGKTYIKHRYYSILGIMSSSETAITNSTVSQNNKKSICFNILNNQINLSHSSPYKISIFSVNGRLLNPTSP